MALFDGIDFVGPIGISDLPGTPGVYLICTDASGGTKILGAYDGGDDMHASAEINPKRQCWQKHKGDTEPVAYYLSLNDPKQRDRTVRGIVERRFYKLDCYDPPHDDF